MQGSQTSASRKRACQATPQLGRWGAVGALGRKSRPPPCCALQRLGPPWRLTLHDLAADGAAGVLSGVQLQARSGGQHGAQQAACSRLRAPP